MNKKQDVQTILSNYVGQFLEEHFGEKPDKVTVTYRSPFLLLHLSGFLLPAEKMFVDRREWNRVLETRDLIIRAVKKELLTGLQEETDLQPTDLYADWNLEKKSGLFIITLAKEPLAAEFPWPETVEQETLKEIILLNSIRTQKMPDQTNFYWLSDQVLLIERIGILVDIEKNLVQNGVIEELRLAKRPLEHRITKLFNLESLLDSHIQELFVDWNFQKDFSYMVLIMEKRTN